jgi:hypothetical protein
MKHFIILLLATFMLPVFLNAQSGDPELDYIKKTYSKEKKDIVDQYMELNVQDGGKFWPVYSAYESKREKLASERLKLIQQYVDYSEGITNAQADKIATAALTNSVNLDKLNLEYYTKMKAAVGGIRAAKFIQLETFLQTSWRSYVQDNIPLISELDKTHTNQ